MTSPGVAADRRGTHAALLWRDNKHQQASVAHWVGAGLARGERVVWTQEHASLRRAMAQHGVDLPTGRNSDDFLRVPLEDLCASGRQAAVLENALEEGYSGVRFTMPANAVLALLGQAGYRRFDEELDNICTHLPVSALCAYDVRE